MYMSLPSASSPWQKKHRCRNEQRLAGVGGGAREEEEQLKEEDTLLTTSLLAVVVWRGGRWLCS
jgi:hypothetical protein